MSSVRAFSLQGLLLLVSLLSCVCALYNAVLAILWQVSPKSMFSAQSVALCLASSYLPQLSLPRAFLSPM